MEFKFVRAEFYHDATNSYEDNVYVVPEAYGDMEVDGHIYPDFDGFIDKLAQTCPDACLEDCHWDWYEIDQEELRAWCIATAQSNAEAYEMYVNYCRSAGFSPVKKAYHVYVSYDVMVMAHNEDEAAELAADDIACNMIDATDFSVVEVGQ